MQRPLPSALARRGRLAVFLALVAFVVAPFPGRAGAQENGNDDLQRLGQQHAEISSQQQQVAGQLADAQQHRVEADATLGTLASQLSSANAKLLGAQADSDRYAFAALVLSDKVQKTQQKLDEAKVERRRSAVLLYQRSDSTAMIDLIGSADASGDIVEGKHYLARVSDMRHAAVERVSALRADLDTEQSKLGEARTRADAARTEAADQQQSIQALYVRQQQAHNEAAAAEQNTNALLEKYSGELAANESEQQAVSDRIASELAQVGDTPSYGNGTFNRPIPGAPIASGFGYRTDPITGQQAFHSGIDFGASCGTPIKAAGTGVVFFAGPDGGYGNATIINHGGGLATLYGHQSAIAVSVGQPVTQGQVIGYVGTTGKSTGCHLHFEVRVNGNPVNPLGYL